jgi:hypothetical protein
MKNGEAADSFRVMLSLNLREPFAPEITQMEPEETRAGQDGEFEFVVGNRQVASGLFVAIVLLVVFSALSYLAGKAATPKIAVALPPPAPAPVLEATITKAPDPPPAVVAAPEPVPEPPVFADPAIGPIYLQMGALEKGLAVIFVEGLRKHGFNAFVAPGPNPKLFRVLIGPFADHTAYAETLRALGEIDLNTFARRYQIELPASEPVRASE